MLKRHEAFVAGGGFPYANGTAGFFCGQPVSPHDTVGGCQRILVSLVGDFAVMYIDDFICNALQIAGA